MCVSQPLHFQGVGTDIGCTPVDAALPITSSSALVCKQLLHVCFCTDNMHIPPDAICAALCHDYNALSAHLIVVKVSHYTSMYITQWLTLASFPGPIREIKRGPGSTTMLNLLLLYTSSNACYGRTRHISNIRSADYHRHKD